MPMIKEEKGFDYYSHPYNPKWRPLNEREWAEKFLNDDGTEDYEGFRNEFRVRNRFLLHNRGDSYLPPSVDYYLRHDSTGLRLDIDTELASIPMDAEEIAELEMHRKAQIREKRNAILRDRGLKPRTPKSADKPVVKSQVLSNEVASRMD